MKVYTRNILLASALFVALLDRTSAQSAPSTPVSTPSFVTQSEPGNLTSQIVGLEVYNRKNKDIARVEDLALGKDGQVQAFILSVGEYLGLLTHFVAVKPSAVKIEFSKANNSWQARMDATADELRAAPEYKYTGTRKACLNILPFTK